MKPRHGKIVLLFAILWAAGSCANQHPFDPSPVSVRESTFYAGIGSYHGVRLIADPGAWEGIPAVAERLTPIKITVHNNYATAIRVLYQHFVLVGDNGTRFAVLNAFNIDEKMRASKPASTTRPPMLNSHYFFPSPRRHDYMPGLPSAREPFPYNPLHYERLRHRKPKEIALPTGYMKSVAFPEGDIKGHESVTGFLYFEKVREVARVELHMDLMKAEDGSVFGRIRVPLAAVD